MITYTCDRCGKKIFGECAEEVEPRITEQEDE